MATSGIPKASVLPEPVGARPQTSRPARASVMVAAWMAKGWVMPRASRARQIRSGTPSRAKVLEGLSDMGLLGRVSAASGGS